MGMNEGNRYNSRSATSASVVATVFVGGGLFTAAIRVGASGIFTLAIFSFRLMGARWQWFVSAVVTRSAGALGTHHDGCKCV